MPPPDNDDDAIKLGHKIREWIKNGRQKPGESKFKKVEDALDSDEEIQKHDKEEKPKKKRGIFGFFKK